MKWSKNEVFSLFWAHRFCAGCAFLRKRCVFGKTLGGAAQARKKNTFYGGVHGVTGVAGGGD